MARATNDRTKPVNEAGRTIRAAAAIRAGLRNLECLAFQPGGRSPDWHLLREHQRGLSRHQSRHLDRGGRDLSTLGNLADQMERRIRPPIMSTRRLVSEVLPLRDVDAALRDRLFALMQRCYHCVTRNRFESDIAEKNYLIVLRDSAGVPRGFSTQLLFCREWEGRAIQVLFSGDTVIEPAYWGSHELVKGWCQVAALALRAEPTRRLFWFLISKGYRTYLYLPLFFHDFEPHHGRSSAGDTHRLLTVLSKKKFGTAYDATTGIVRFPIPIGQLTPEFAEIPDARRDDPHVQFFLDRNPGYALGDELACLAEVSPENTHGLGRRWLERAMHAISPHD